MKLKKFTAIIITYAHILNLANQKWLSHFDDLRWNDPKSKRVIKW